MRGRKRFARRSALQVRPKRPMHCMLLATPPVGGVPRKRRPRVPLYPPMSSRNRAEQRRGETTVGERRAGAVRAPSLRKARRRPASGPRGPTRTTRRTAAAARSVSTSAGSGAMSGGWRGADGRVRGAASPDRSGRAPKAFRSWRRALPCVRGGGSREDGKVDPKSGGMAEHEHRCHRHDMTRRSRMLRSRGGRAGPGLSS